MVVPLDGKGVWYPVQFGERQEKLIESGVTGRGEWFIQQVELMKRDGEWYAYFILERPFKDYEPNTAVGVDIGERNLATLVALVDGKPVRGTFFKGSRTKEVRHKYSLIRKKLQEKRRLDVVKRLSGKERRMVDHGLHVISKKNCRVRQTIPFTSDSDGEAHEDQGELQEGQEAQ